MKIKKFLLLIPVFSLVACDKTNPANDVNNLTYFDGQVLHYLSSDADFDSFMNDFAHKNMRYDDNAVGVYETGHGTNFAKNWEAMALTFQNAVGNVYGEDKIEAIYNHLVNIPQNAQGMIYNTSGRDGYKNVEGDNCPHGWPFPTWKDSTINYRDAGSLRAVQTTAFEFNLVNEQQSKNWTVDGGTFNITKNGYVEFSTSSNNNSLKFYKDDLATLLPSSHGINTQVAPLVEFDVSFTSNNLEDFYIIFKTSDTGDTWHRVKQSLYSTNPNTNFASFSDRVWVEMYLNEEWNNKTVTAIGMEFIPKEGKKLTITDGILNYIRPSYDTRQSNGTYQWILALYNYYQYTQNIANVAKLMPKARKAIMFLNHFLDGSNGLLDISFFYGHNGITLYQDASGNWLRDPAQGIGNGYWDLLAPSEKNLEANVYYYQALVALAKLEKAMLDADINIDKNESVIINKVPGENSLTYADDVNSLLDLAASVKTNIESNVNVVPDGTMFKNAGGFWNPETKRFVFGINEKTGQIKDEGYIYFNEEAICADIGTTTQQKDVMDWINGTRIIDEDKSKGKDIYFYEFAPRFSTCDTTFSYSGQGLPTLKWFGEQHEIDVGDSWSRQVQNGGAVIAWSYYDIVARAKVLGSDNAFARLKEINNWYKKVQAAKVDDGYYFYEGYYDAMEESVENTDLKAMYTLQNSSITGNGAGAIGLNGEFIESVIFIRSLIDSFGKIDGANLNNLNFENNLCSNLTFIQHDNLRYKNASYSLKITHDGFQLFDIKGEIDNKTFVTFSFKNCNQNTKVFVDNIETTDFTYSDGIISIKLNFDNVKVTIK